MPTRALPPQLRVFVRDWLSSNNVLLKSRDGHVLIDSGYVRHASLTLALLDSRQGVGAEPLAALVNTHCHSDHMGGNAAIVRRYGCTLSIPAGEAPLVERWDQQALLLDYADQQADRFSADALLVAGETRVWGDLEWRLLAAPGHDMGALMFHNEEYGVLISGDALWENGFGFVMPPEIDPAALPAARATLDLIAGLDVRVLVPGHGQPFTDVSAALDRSYARLAMFEREPERLPRYALKVILAFVLLDKRRLPLADMPAYVERVGIFRDFNARFLHLEPEALASALVRDLEKAGAARCEAGYVMPR